MSPFSSEAQEHHGHRDDHELGRRARNRQTLRVPLPILRVVEEILALRQRADNSPCLNN